MWDVAARKRCAAVKPFSNESHIDLSLDSRKVAIKNTQGDVAVYDIDLIGEPVRLSGKSYGEGDRICFSPDGEFVIDSSWRGDFLVRDASSGELQWKSDLQAWSVTPRRDRKLWAFTTETGIGLQRWPFWENDPVVYDFPGADRRGPFAFALADESERVVVAGSGAVEVWTLEASRGDATVTASWPTAASGTGEAVAWHPSESFVAHAGARAASILTADLTPVWHTEFDYPSDVAFSPDGSLLAVGDWSKGAVFAFSA